MLIRPIKISAKVPNKDNFILNILVINPFCTTITVKRAKIICFVDNKPAGYNTPKKGAFTPLNRLFKG